MAIPIQKLYNPNTKFMAITLLIVVYCFCDVCKAVFMSLKTILMRKGHERLIKPEPRKEINLRIQVAIFYHRFWLAVEDLKKRPNREVPARVQEIWQEFLAPGAPSAINLDSKSYDKTTQNVKDPGRYTFEDAQVSI